MLQPKPALSDEDLMALLRKEAQAAAAYQDARSPPCAGRRWATTTAQPYGDDQEGASQVVTSEFADVIESLMPGRMPVFTAADDLVRFTLGAPEMRRRRQ